DAHRAHDLRRRPLDDADGRDVARGAAPEDADGAVAVVRDGDLVALAIDVDGHRPVQAGPRALDRTNRRDVAFGVRVVNRDRRLVESAADDRLRLGDARAT